MNEQLLINAGFELVGKTCCDSPRKVVYKKGNKKIYLSKKNIGLVVDGFKRTFYPFSELEKAIKDAGTW